MGDWIEWTVYQSLIEPQKMMGMPRNLGILIGTLTLAMVVGGGMVWFLGVAAVLVVISNVMGKQDIWFFEIARQVLPLSEEYD